jgi:hypothetical protein
VDILRIFVLAMTGHCLQFCATMNTENDSNGNGAGDGTQVLAQNRVKRTPPTKTLPSDRLAFEKQVAALRAFAVVYEANGNKPVTNEDAGKIINMSGNTVVVTNGFFSDVRLLSRQKDGPALIPSAETLAYYKAYEWDPSTAGEKLRPVFERCWFSEVLVPRLKFRPYEEREALTVLAEACSAAKEYEPRLQVLLDYMVFAGVVLRDGGQIKSAGLKGSDPAPEVPKLESSGAKREGSPIVDEDHEQYTLILDAKLKRKVVIQAPHTITTKELERIRAWLGVQLIVDEGT